MDKKLTLPRLAINRLTTQDIKDILEVNGFNLSKGFKFETDQENLQVTYTQEYTIKEKLNALYGKGTIKADNVEINENNTARGMINKVACLTHINADNHGFWNYHKSIDPQDKQAIQASISQFLLLIVTEIAEATEGMRKGDKDNFGEELADIIIRTMDLAIALNVDIEREINHKMEKNRQRDFMHGKEF